MRIAGLFAFTLFVASGAAFAEGATPSVETASVVTAVSLHPDAAIVTREATVTLPDGASTVIFTGVPANLATDSLRASGEATNALTLGAVEARLKPQIVKPAEGSPSARLKELRTQRATLEVSLDALRAKLEMIKAYGQLDPEKSGRDPKPLAPADWSLAFDTIAAAHAKTGEEIRLATDKSAELDAAIAELQAGGATEPTPRQRFNLAVAVDSKGGGAAKLRLTYRSDAAFWRPAYAARLQTGDKNQAASLELETRAVVTQRTGEDWKDAALTVSTLRARRAASAPEVAPERVAFREAPVPAALPAAGPAPMAKARNMAAMKSAAGGAILEAFRPGTAPPEYSDAAQASSVVDATGYAATYKIAEPGDATGDGTPKNFLLATRHIEPKLAIRTAPELDPQAYLEAHLVNDGDAPLLPGQMSVERDGVLVGAQQIALLAPGDARDFGFGVDDKVKVTRAPVKRKENEPTWFGQTKTETREFKTTVKNFHDFAVNVTVVDRAPYSENSVIEVETLPQTTPPSEKQLGDKRGVMAWSFALQPGETKEILLAYRIKWPAEREIVFEPAPAGR